MVVEIVCGLAYHSMALLADGAHMATHVGALGLAAGAYWLARRHAVSGRFSFGSGKFGDLAAFSSAIILGITALAVAVESVQRIVSPAAVAYGDALLIACIGLGWLGTKPPEGVYVIMSRLLTFYYFAFFIIVLPLLGIFEKTKPLPNSISESVLGAKA